MILQRDDGKILLGLRKDFNQWSAFGGAVELFDSISDTLFKELKEETGLRPVDYHFYGILSEKSLSLCEYPNGDIVHAVSCLFHVTKWEGELIVEEEHSRCQWFDLENLPDLMPFTQSEISVFQDYQKTKQFQLR